MDGNHVPSSPSGDEIALCVLNAFSGLHSKFKPLQSNVPVKEWVPLAGIVLQKSMCEASMKFNSSSTYENVRWLSTDLCFRLVSAHSHLGCK
jgi:hypothetical protein